MPLTQVQRREASLFALSNPLAWPGGEGAPQHTPAVGPFAGAFGDGGSGRGPPIAVNHDTAYFEVSDPAIQQTPNGDAFVFPSDYRRNVSFRATSIFNVSTECTTLVSTFTRSAAFAAAREAQGSRLASFCERGGRAADGCVVYTGSKYMAGGPTAGQGQGQGQGQGHQGGGGGGGGGAASFSKAGLFDNFAGNASDIRFQIQIRPEATSLAYIDQVVGNVIISPLGQHVGQNFTVVLEGVDVHGATAKVEEWAFTVGVRPVFKVLNFTRATQAVLAEQIVDLKARASTGPLPVGEPFSVAPVLLTGVAPPTADRGKCTFTLRGTSVGNASQSIFINPSTGAVQGMVDQDQLYQFVLEAIDEHGSHAVVENVTLNFTRRDTAVESYGPNARPVLRSTAVK